MGVLFLGAVSAWSARFSPLAPKPDWQRLQAYQQTILRADFVRLINEVYSPDGGFWKYSSLGEDRVTVFSDTARLQPLITLHFAPDAASRRPRPVVFAPERQVPPAPDASRPLEGIHICLDPGHIGGEWSRLEERYFKVGTDAPIEEAELNWITCLNIEKQLQSLGAHISWAKDHNQPATPLRPEQLRDEAIQAITENGAWPTGPLDPVAIEKQVEDRANGLFYRTAEIFARADRVTRLKPDLTLCIHFNAAAWGDPKNPQLIETSKLVLFINGAYAESELAFDDQKFNLLVKLLDNTYPYERRGAEFIAEEMLSRFKMTPELYPGWNMVKKIGPTPTVFARNLMANRTYPGPVIFVEGPYMNARDTYPRLLAGDYEGTRTINGVEQISIFREFADAVVAGVRRYFETK